jgi:hypothetical protein
MARNNKPKPMPYTEACPDLGVNGSLPSQEAIDGGRVRALAQGLLRVSAQGNTASALYYYAESREGSKWISMQQAQIETGLKPLPEVVDIQSQEPNFPSEAQRRANRESQRRNPDYDKRRALAEEILNGDAPANETAQLLAHVGMAHLLPETETESIEERTAA